MILVQLDQQLWVPETTGKVTKVNKENKQRGGKKKNNTFLGQAFIQKGYCDKGKARTFARLKKLNTAVTDVRLQNSPQKP